MEVTLIADPNIVKERRAFIGRRVLLPGALALGIAASIELSHTMNYDFQFTSTRTAHGVAGGMAIAGLLLGGVYSLRSSQLLDAANTRVIVDPSNYVITIETPTAVGIHTSTVPYAALLEPDSSGNNGALLRFIGSSGEETIRLPYTPKSTAAESLKSHVMSSDTIFQRLRAK